MIHNKEQTITQPVPELSLKPEVYSHLINNKIYVDCYGGFRQEIVEIINELTNGSSSTKLFFLELFVRLTGPLIKNQFEPLLQNQNIASKFYPFLFDIALTLRHLGLSYKEKNIILNGLTAKDRFFQKVAHLIIEKLNQEFVGLSFISHPILNEKKTTEKVAFSDTEISNFFNMVESLTGKKLLLILCEADIELLENAEPGEQRTEVVDYFSLAHHYFENLDTQARFILLSNPFSAPEEQNLESNEKYLKTGPLTESQFKAMLNTDILRYEPETVDYLWKMTGGIQSLFIEIRRNIIRYHRDTINLEMGYLQFVNDLPSLLNNTLNKFSTNDKTNALLSQITPLVLKETFPQNHNETRLVVNMKQAQEAVREFLEQDRFNGSNFLILSFTPKERMLIASLIQDGKINNDLIIDTTNISEKQIATLDTLVVKGILAKNENDYTLQVVYIFELLK